MGCQHLDDIYELYLLGSVAAEESAEISGHVERNCLYCVDRLREALQVVYLLGLNSGAVPPSPKRKAELLRRVKKLKED